MHTRADYESRVISHLLGNLPAGFTQSQVKLPNFPDPATNDSPWLAVTMIDTGTTNQDANGCFRVVSGILNIDVYWPKGQGSKDANIAAESIRVAFTNNWLEAMKVGQGNIRESNSDSWYRLIVEFPYTYEGLTDGS